jgi:predicted DNA-binding transcriptional regulator
MIKNKTLQKIGFDKNEAKVYLALLELHEGLPTDISRKTKLHRPLVYKALSVLIDKGLVSLASKGKRKTYVAESPEKLETLFRELEQNFFADIEDLHFLYETSQKKPTVLYAQGEDAIRDVYRDVVESTEKGDRYYRYSSVKAIKREKFLPKNYREIRDRKGLERWMITGAGAKANPNKLGRSIKRIPKSFDPFEDDINVVMYKDKVAIVDYPSLATITIQHKAFAEFQKKIFKLLFSKL